MSEETKGTITQFINNITKDETSLRYFFETVIIVIVLTFILPGEIPYIKGSENTDLAGRLFGALVIIFLLFDLSILSRMNHKTNSQSSIKGHNEDSLPDTAPHSPETGEIVIREEVSKETVKTIKKLHKDGRTPSPLVIYRELWAHKILKDDDYDELVTYVLNPGEKKG